MDKPEIVRKLLVCVLTDDEVRERSARASRLLGDLEDAKLREKHAERARKRAVDELPESAVLSEVRAECENIETEARKAARVSREGKEERLVECRWEPQGEREVLVRLDTGELIDSRVSERTTSRQMSLLEGSEGAAGDAPKPPTEGLN